MLTNQRQTNTSSAPGHAFWCDDRETLCQALLDATSDLTFLEREREEAALLGTLPVERFDVLIRNTELRKRRARIEYLRHVEHHGCCG